MGRIREALQQLNEIETTHHKLDDIKLKHKLHLPNLEYEDELDDNGDPVIDQETGRKKRVRVPSSYIYVITGNNPETDEPFKYVCKIGYAKDTDIRLGNFNKDAGNVISLDWFARIPIYHGEYDSDRNEFKPVAGYTDQLDKRIHRIIDTVTDTADKYMQRKYKSENGIDLRKLDVNGHRKEWYSMEPQQAVNIIEAIIASQPASLFGETEYNTKHPLYTQTHSVTSYDDQGNKITKTKRNVGAKYDYIRRTENWGRWYVSVGGGGRAGVGRFYIMSTNGFALSPTSNGTTWTVDYYETNMNDEGVKYLYSIDPSKFSQSKIYSSLTKLSTEQVLKAFPDIPRPWLDYMSDNDKYWKLDGESDKHMIALNNMIPENEKEA